VSPSRLRFVYAGTVGGSFIGVVAVAWILGGSDEALAWFVRAAFAFGAAVQVLIGFAIWRGTPATSANRRQYWAVALARLLMAAALVVGLISTFAGADFRIVVALFAVALVLGWFGRRGLSDAPSTPDVAPR
jgi:hypothetical protein